MVPIADADTGSESGSSAADDDDETGDAIEEESSAKSTNAKCRRTASEEDA